LRFSIRKCWLNGADVAVIGPKLELTYPYQHIGEGVPALADALSGGASGLLVSRVSSLIHSVLLSAPSSVFTLPS
jgi:NADH-quinone oxidoreductase subunit G